jgi:hypothetical protein
MKKRERNIPLYIVLSIIIIAVIVGIIFLLNYYSKEKINNNKEGSYQTQNAGSTQQKEVVYRAVTEEDYKNFKEILAKNSLIQDLPGDAKIALQFYNFNSGEREWEKSYVLTKGEVNEGVINDYDIRLIMHSKYLTILDENNLCNVIQRAQNNNDFASETAMSTASLLWKYKGVLKYKSCLGL